MTSYTNYFNKRYDHIGHLFQGAYQYKDCATILDSLYVSAYIHKNPIELSKWAHQYKEYPYSSCDAYLKQDNLNDMLNISFLLKDFRSPGLYEEYLDSQKIKAVEWTK